MGKNKCLILLLVFCGCAPIYSAPRDAGCSFFPKSKDNRYQPVILQEHGSHYEFLLPENGEIEIKKGDEITLLCSSPKNSFNNVNSQTVNAECVGGDEFSVNSRKFDFDEFICKKQVTGDIKMTNKNCAQNKGEIIEVGYKLEDNQWVTLYEVCHNRDLGSTYYSEHEMHGAAQEYAISESYRPSFRVDGLGKISAEAAYKRQYQKSTFSRLLGSSKLADEYINEKSYLARGHLAPDADFIYPSWQFTTYFYINVCPQWQSINGGNWVTLEKNIRKFAKETKREYKIFTGTHEVLSLPDENNNQQEIYLVSKNKLPVPKFVFKILYSVSDSKAIAFVSINNPFIKRVDKKDLICKEDVCRKYGWEHSKWRNTAQGYMYCCEVKELMKEVATLPPLKVTGGLYYNRKRMLDDDD